MNWFWVEAASIGCSSMAEKLCVKNIKQNEKDIIAMRVVITEISWASSKIKDWFTFGAEYLRFSRHISV